MVELEAIAAAAVIELEAITVIEVNRGGCCCCRIRGDSGRNRGGCCCGRIRSYRSGSHDTIIELGATVGVEIVAADDVVAELGATHSGRKWDGCGRLSSHRSGGAVVCHANCKAHVRFSYQNYSQQYSRQKHL